MLYFVGCEWGVGGGPKPGEDTFFFSEGLWLASDNELEDYIHLLLTSFVFVL